MSDPASRLNAALEGRYAIERELGEGGMATVYLADDLKHERKVALKVLKPELAALVGAERFLAEIKTTANLQHPHILPLFDSGEADGFLFYVMPFVEGETLRDRIDREKQLPVDDAVSIATNVAEALDYAHRKGVIHRDIKPANILLQDGKPVISDFGIALAVGVAGGGRLTETGLSVGTPHYMSPEQATGDQTVGAATDTYALAAVLYEMLIGDPPYVGSTAQAILGKIIAGKLASANEERASVPVNVDAAIRKALEKLPADRFASTNEFMKALADPGFRHPTDVRAGVARDRSVWNPLSVGASGVAVAFAVGFAWSLLRPEPVVPVSRLELWLPNGLEYARAGAANLAISPDGSQTVFVGTTSARPQLWLRPLAQGTATPIAGTEGALSPRFSPDGRSIVFFRGEDLLTVSLSGGSPRVVTSDVRSPGSAWGRDEMIYFTGTDGALWRVSTNAGEPERLTTLGAGETSHILQDVLPNGEGVLFARRPAPSSIAILSLETGQVRPLFPGVTARYASSGHVLYVSREGILTGVPFDPVGLEETGAHRPLEEGVRTTDLSSDFAISESGSLVYLSGTFGEGATELVWVTRDGEAVPVEPGWLFTPAGSNYGWRLSPDGARAAITVVDEQNINIGIKQLPAGPFSRLTVAPGTERHAVWTSDGDFVVYSGGQGTSSTNRDIWRQRADGTGEPERLVDDQRGLDQPQLNPSGEWLVMRTTALGTLPGARDILGLRLGVDSATTPLIATVEFAEQSPAFSRDGRWLAYTSNVTGREEVYVSPFPDVDSSRVSVSDNGGISPVWSHGGDELFFVDDDRRLVSARFETDPTFRVVSMQPLFTLGPEYAVSEIGDFYDIDLDDERFLMGRAPGAGGGEESQRLVVVLNFLEELKLLVPN